MDWEYGQKRKLCKLADITEQDLQGILCRRVRCNPQRAAHLAAACEGLGIDIPLEHWVWNLETMHSAFRGEPVLDQPDNVKLKKG